MSKPLFLTCACHHQCHVLRIDEWDPEDGYPLALTVHLCVDSISWWRRIWVGIRYILRPSWTRYGSCWCDFLLTKEGAQQLADRCQEVVKTEEADA